VSFFVYYVFFFSLSTLSLPAQKVHFKYYKKLILQNSPGEKKKIKKKKKNIKKSGGGGGGYNINYKVRWEIRI